MPFIELVVQVPRRRVLNDSGFLQVFVEGVNPIRRDVSTIVVLQEAVVSTDREEVVTFRVHGQFERDP